MLPTRSKRNPCGIFGPTLKCNGEERKTKKNKKKRRFGPGFRGQID